ncbi:MAG: GGDEF domain-containing protein [Nitrospirae bacterium]|nr:GGDEF domain-containing protein [Nitrospirota bacterium]
MNEGQLMFDRLTQTLNREFFGYLLDLEVKKAARYLYFFSLMVLQRDKVPYDLSNEEEDLLLKKLAALVKEEVRGTDSIGRIGHDKFFIIIDQADSRACFKVGDRIRDRIENYAFRVDGHEITLTASIGTACFPTHANDLESLLHKAEFALSLARGSGGGRVCLPE